MDQTKWESRIEATANIGSGFVISLCVWAWIVAPLISTDILTIHNTLTITTIFTISSWLRSYYWRRFFNAGFHKAVHHWVTKFKYRNNPKCVICATPLTNDEIKYYGTTCNDCEGEFCRKMNEER